MQQITAATTEAHDLPPETIVVIIKENSAENVGVEVLIADLLTLNLGNKQ